MGLLARWRRCEAAMWQEMERRFVWRVEMFPEDSARRVVEGQSLLRPEDWTLVLREGIRAFTGKPLRAESAERFPGRTTGSA